jgi:hypothetical protein
MPGYLTLFCVALLSLPAAVGAVPQEDGRAPRVPFDEGGRAIYQNLCRTVCENSGPDCEAECLDRSTEAWMKNAPQDEEFAVCFERGGILQASIEPCAQAIHQIASLSLESSVKQALQVSLAIQRKCSGAALCEGTPALEAP